MHENNCWMLAVLCRADQRACKSNFSIGEDDVFSLLNLHPSRCTRGGVSSTPRQGCQPALTASLKVNSRFNRRWNGGTRTGKESVVIDRIQRSNLTRLVKCDQLILPCELAPHLDIEKGIRFPLIHARIS